MTRIANFIDGGYLEKSLRGYCIDHNVLALIMTGDHDLLRTYYYDCLPYQSCPPTDYDIRRIDAKRRFISALERLPRFTVRLGQLEIRGEDGREVQKRVDTLLALDLYDLSVKHQITDAAILAGDSDLLPAIERAKAEGVVIHLFHGPSVHRDMLRCCDEHTPITAEFVQSLLYAQQQKRRPAGLLHVQQRAEGSHRHCGVQAEPVP